MVLRWDLIGPARRRRHPRILLRFLILLLLLAGAGSASAVSFVPGDLFIADVNALAGQTGG